MKLPAFNILLEAVKHPSLKQSLEFKAGRIEVLQDEGKGEGRLRGEE